MTYVQSGKIEASDFNALTGNTTTTENTFNVIWANGTGSAGYGQTGISNVSSGNLVEATGKWQTLVTNIANISYHQGSTISSITAPTAGTAPDSIVKFLSALKNNLTTIYTNRINASTQGSSSFEETTFNSAWQNSITFTSIATFANGDAARYFFNSGGQLKISFEHPTGTGINLGISDLAANVGNVFVSAPTSGTSTIVENSFYGITKVGGGGNSPDVYAINNGYHALTTSNATVFTQSASTGPSLDTNIEIKLKSNGTQGLNADSGNVITVYSTWTQIPTGLVALPGSTAKLTVIYPSTTFIGNSWGTVSLSGTVSGN